MQFPLQYGLKQITTIANIYYIPIKYLLTSRPTITHLTSRKSFSPYLRRIKCSSIFPSGAVRSRSNVQSQSRLSAKLFRVALDAARSSSGNPLSISTSFKTINFNWN